MRLLERLRGVLRSGRTPTTVTQQVPETELIPATTRPPEDYEQRLARERELYKDNVTISDLPPIFHYWAKAYIRPLLEQCGVSNPDDFFAKYLLESARSTGTARFLSVGSGNCDNEIRIAQSLRALGLEQFQIRCLDLNPEMLERGRAAAEAEGLGAFFEYESGDFNSWKANGQSYTGVLAIHSLHHVVQLEHLFEQLEKALDPGGYLIVNDMIGRNGHARWPEALEHVHRFWQELPPTYRYNRQLRRHEELYENWDCSMDGFEGIRAQDILPLLNERFYFRVFIPFSNIIDVFVDRGFGYNFDREAEWDRSFVDRVQAFDEDALLNQLVTPTKMLAVLSKAVPEKPFFSRNLRPEHCIRRP